MIGAKGGFSNNGINWPDASESGYRVPYGVFTDESVYREEQENIFRGPSWSFVALEAEIPNRGDFKSTFIGEVPVVVVRNNEGEVNVLLNRCAHRGAAVCRKLHGNTSYLECVYHSWAYDLDGNLTSVPFRRGVRGKGGMPSDFSMAEHGLKKIRVQIIKGLVFATFRSETPDLEKYLGTRMVGAIKRIFNREIKVLGDERQRIHGNWKLYAENVRDPYHASLLHLFHATFGLYRSTQVGSCVMDDLGRHSLLVASQGTSSEDDDEDAYSDQRSFNSKFVLQDPSLLKGKREFDDDISLVILSIFPNLVVQQISNTLAVRQIVTYSPNEFELVWTMFGYKDDDDEMRRIRIKQNNLIGPGGLVSMEDGEAVELVTRAITQGSGDSSFIAMGGVKAESADHLITEGAIIGFWQHYRELMRN